MDGTNVSWTVLGNSEKLQRVMKDRTL